MAACDKSLIRFPIPAATAAMPHCSEIIVRKSRFLAQSCHCASAGAARAFAALARQRHLDATHNCWAFAAGAPGCTASIGSSDDGEPHGTAGKPMLHALLHSGIGQICIVVSRWFGGIKLGTGGLARAYQDAVSGNLEFLPLKERVRLMRCKLSLEYSHQDAARRALAGMEGIIEREEYGSRVEFQIALPEDRVQEFDATIAGLSNGMAKVEPVNPECRVSSS